MAHGARLKAHGKKFKNVILNMGNRNGMDGVIRRLPVKWKDGSIDLIEIEGIFYFEAK
jgi:hypothetical protein